MELNKIYITKYCLTQGITTAQAEIKYNYSKPMAIVDKYRYYHGDEFHTNIDSAISKAENMRLKKINSLEKQIDKLKNISF